MPLCTVRAPIPNGMCRIFSPIHHFFAPQADRHQFFRALGMLFAIPKYQYGGSIEKLEQSIAKTFHHDAFLFCTGTDALVAILKTLNLQKEDELIVPAYTCFSPGGAVTAAGGTVVFTDVSPHTLSLSFSAIEKSLSSKTRAIIAQHTFGIPAEEMAALRDLCDRRKILLIEDCAHLVPDGEVHSIGTYGHAVILSFGRYKAISGMAGGAVICNDSALAAKVREIQKNSLMIEQSVIARLLLYPILFPLARPFIGIGIGTLGLWLCKKFHILLIGSTPDELGWKVGETTYRIPNACAFLALDQWEQRAEINDLRRNLTRYYREQAELNHWIFPSSITDNLPLQKFPIFLPGAERIRKALRRKNIHLYDGCWSRAHLTESGTLAYLYLHQELLQGERGASAMMLPIHSTMSLRKAKQLIKELIKLTHTKDEHDAYYEAPSYPEVNAYAL